MPLYRCNLLGGYNLAHPDVHWEGNLASNATKTLTLTKKPRLVIQTFARYGDSGGTGYSGTRVIDVEHEKFSNSYYINSGYGHGNDGSGLSVITAVSSTSLTFKNDRGYTTRNFILIYY